MKKIFAIIMALAISLSMCACSHVATESASQDADVKQNQDAEAVLESVDFVITKLEWEEHAINSSSYPIYRAVIKSDEHAVMIEITSEEYTLWEIGDAVHGDILQSYRNLSGSLSPYSIRIGEKEFDVKWYGKLT